MNKSAFIPIFERLKNQIKATLAKYKLPIQAQSHLLNSLDYNVPHGKMLRGLSVPNSLYILDPTKSLDEAAILGWAVEFLQASFLIADDIMDHSTVRRGRPCWYKKVELTAVNDAFLVESMVYQIIKLNFKSDKYVRIVDLFHEISFKTELGQLMDLITAPETVDIDKFTRETYEYIVEYKTAYYSFYLPVALALILNDNDESCFVIAQGILCKLGEYFQVQDDYLDCFGDESVIGKVGTDIRDNKCSWLIITALELVSPEQMDILRKNYGRKDDSCQDQVKQVYRDLDLPRYYREYEEMSYANIMNMIQQVDEDKLPRRIFHDILEMIYKRDK